MSEQDGYLRMATTDFGWWGWGGTGTEEGNNVFVLEDDAGALNQVGELRGVAPGEQIYAARFMGDVGYLVTFLQTDPLFTLDLSDPSAPTVVGELEVNGYSSYLHPAGADHLLAVGMDADDSGSVLGFQVSLFDISDLSAPTLAFSLSSGASTTATCRTTAAVPTTPGTTAVTAATRPGCGAASSSRTGSTA